ADMLESNPDEKYFIVCCDIGKFKLINEFNGIAVGDKILKSIAQELKEKTVIGEIYGRIDNDRFALLIPKDRLNLQILIDESQRIFKESVNLSILPTCYFGVYEIEDTDMRVSFMCDRAFIAIDTIKGQYGKQVAWYDSKLRDSALREQELVYQLSEAISTGQIKIYLQPQSTIDGKAVGAEALVRWEHPDEGIVSPAEFIPIFEKNGMITKIDRYVWRLVFQKLFEWKTAGRDDFYISVNISPKDFYLMSIINEFNELLEKFNIDPKNLHIELSEDVMMGDLERQIKLIDQLHKIGFTIEIGDFGAGNTSLKILRECNIDILKIDIGFLQNTSSPRNAHIIMKELISMARNLGMKILAKGIEAKDQMDLLHEEGCDLFQGYYFSKPIDTKSFERIYL
ncbi:MAG: EAL domain-containing protein, partial [Treponema sp.]|nr:EAL domain-containing protein [Treponema sp.]